MTDDETHALIRANMPRLRGDRSFSLIGRLAGTSASAIKEIEEGDRMPGLALTTRICDALGCSLDQLLRPIKKSRRSA